MGANLYFGTSLLVAEICDINRFRSNKKLESWAGLVPSIHQSGEVVAGGRIGKQGNRLVRWVMVQAAHIARLHDERFGGFYERYARREGDKKAVVGVAHEMLRILYFMLKENETYCGGGGGLSWRKLKRLETKSLIGFQA
ncbi:MAG: transposase [Candidatus Bathycorpusculaceae bacterium]